MTRTVDEVSRCKSWLETAARRRPVLRSGPPHGGTAAGAGCACRALAEQKVPLASVLGDPNCFGTTISYCLSHGKRCLYLLSCVTLTDSMFGSVVFQVVSEQMYFPDAMRHGVLCVPGAHLDSPVIFRTFCEYSGEGMRLKACGSAPLQWHTPVVACGLQTATCRRMKDRTQHGSEGG